METTIKLLMEIFYGIFPQKKEKYTQILYLGIFLTLQRICQS